MHRLWIATLIALCLASSAWAEDVVAGLSQDRVEITTDFDGSEILIYGAVRREAPIPQDSRLDVIVTIEGPSRPVTIRRKENIGGIWVNASSLSLGQAPSFYAVSTTSALADALTPQADATHRISVDRAIRAGREDRPEETPYLAALMRLRGQDGLYQVNEGAVSLAQDTLFSTSVRLPAQLVEGNYRLRIFLTRAGQVITAQDQVILVRKVGLERAAYRLSQDRPLIYGFLALMIAVFVGWGVSALFRLLRR